MGLFSSKSSSSSTVNNVSSSSTTNQDNRIAVTDQGIGFKLDGDGNAITITQTDRGAVAAGVDLAATALALGGATIDSNTLVSLGAIDSLSKAHTAQIGIQADLAREANAQVAAAERAAGQRISDGFTAYSRDLVQGYETFAGQLGSSLDSVLDFGRDQTARAAATTNDALAAIRTTNDRIVSHITETQKTPDERSFQAVVPWLVIGGTVAVIFIFGRRK